MVSREYVGKQYLKDASSANVKKNFWSKFLQNVFFLDLSQNYVAGISFKNWSGFKIFETKHMVEYAFEMLQSSWNYFFFLAVKDDRKIH